MICVVIWPQIFLILPIFLQIASGKIWKWMERGWLGKVIPSPWKELHTKPATTLVQAWATPSQFRIQTWQEHPSSGNKKDVKLKAMDSSPVVSVQRCSRVRSPVREETVRVHCMNLWGWSLSCILRPQDVEIPKLWDTCHGELYIKSASN